jgi:hypothetical protein
MFNREKSTTHASLISTGLILDVTTVIEDYLIPIRGDQNDDEWELVVLMNGFMEYTHATVGGWEKIESRIKNMLLMDKKDYKLVCGYIISGIGNTYRIAAILLSMGFVDLPRFLISMDHPDLCLKSDCINYIKILVELCEDFRCIHFLEMIPITNLLDPRTMEVLMKFLINHASLQVIKIILKKIHPNGYHNIAYLLKDNKLVKKRPELLEFVEELFPRPAESENHWVRTIIPGIND